MSLQIIENEHTKNEYLETSLNLKISGDNVHYETINSLRKICINQIPSYAFHQANIKILKNSSVFDDTYMKHRLSFITIRNLDIDNNNYRIEYYGSFQNNNLTQNYFTENEVIKKIDDKIIDNNIENVSTVIQLNLSQNFEFSMFATKDVGEHNAIFNTAHVYYDYDDNNNFNFTIESYGQYTEYDILIKGCELLCEKYDVIAKTIHENQNTIKFDNDNVIILNVENEDLTTFGPIKYFLLQSENVIFAGVGRYEGFLIKNVSLKLKTSNNTTPFREISKSIALCVDFYENFKNKLLKLKNKEMDVVKSEKIIKKKTKKM